MDKDLEQKIIESTITSVGVHGTCSIKLAAEKCFYPGITLLEQKKLAKAIATQSAFVTEIKKGEVIVRRNERFLGARTDSKKEFELMKATLAVLAALIAFLIFNVLMPWLNKNM